MTCYEDQHTVTIYNRDPNDSEESEGETGLGNVNRLIVRPAGHSGKAKRGHLCFDAAFECGNLGRADHISDIEYDLHVRPDTCRPRARFWFNFTVENVRQDQIVTGMLKTMGYTHKTAPLVKSHLQRVIFNIVNFGKELTLFNGDMTPLVRSTSRMKWVRIPRRLIFCHKSVLHRGHKILSIAFAFDREEDIYQFTAGAPYSYSRLQKHLALWEKKAQTFATRESIAQTTQKRRIDLVTIENKTAIEDQVPVKGKGGQKKRYVVIMARSHGGEPPASFICQGFLDYMASSSEKAIALRNGIVIKVIPMLNPDGVFLGNQRSDLLGADLNRSWDNATKFAHPGLIAATDVVDKLTAEGIKDVQLDFIIDIHADISHEGVFVRGNSYDDVYRFERHAVLPKFLGGRIEAWRQEACLFNADPTVVGSARRALPIGPVDAYTLLASLGGRRLSARGPYIHYTEEAYAKIGRSIAKALCDYYRHIGVIPPRVSRDKKKEERGRRRRKRPVTGKERSPSSSPERRVLPPRVLSPSLPAASPAFNVLPARTAKHLRTARPRILPEVCDHALPIITGTAVKTPRLSVVDMSAYIRTPAGFFTYHLEGRPARLARPARPSHARFTSDEYDTQESDSDHKH